MSPDVVYAAEVVAVGEMIPEFRRQGMLVFFGEPTPQELHDFVIRHRPTVCGRPPQAGDVVELDGERLTISAVGHVVADNLRNLGHFCLKADGSRQAPLPGDVCVEARPLPSLAAGSVLRILAAPSPDSAPPEERS